MKTKEEYETFGLEWKKEISKVPKSMIIDMLSNKGKEVESLRNELDILKQGLHGIYNLCDNDNPTHEHIWHVANDLLTSPQGE